MAWDVEVNHYMNLAVVTLWGRVSADERAQALDRVLACMEPAREYRLLVDMIGAHAAAEPCAAVDAHATRLALVARERGWRVAYLYPAGSRAHQLVEHLSTCVPEFAFRRFNAVIDAMDWLLAPVPRLETLPPLATQAAPLASPTAATPSTRRGGLRRWFA